MISKRKITPYPIYNSYNPLLSEYMDSLDIFLDKPFWIWDQKEHNQQLLKTTAHCCFEHIIGKPIKNNKEYEIFDFRVKNFIYTLSTKCKLHMIIFWMH